MLKRKLSTLILVVTMTNFLSTPLSVFAETLSNNVIIQESQDEQKNGIQSNISKVSRFDEYYSDKRQAYDEVFKMDNSNIESIKSAGGALRNTVGTENIIDGNLDTYWETGKHTSDSFNNELIFTLKEKTVLNRIAYRSAWNTVGFAESFEIWASNTDNEEDFQLVSTGTATKTADVIEIKFNPTEFKKIKFVFKNSGTATASEMMFYREDASLDKVKNLFTDNTMSVVSDEFNTLDKINELEEEFKSHPFYEEYKENFENARALLNQKTIESTEAKVSKFDSYYSDEKQAYDEAFKMDNSNIESIVSTGGNRASSVGTGNIIDGNLDTYWETGKHTSDSFNNELIFTLKENTVLNRIAYRSAWNTVGFAENFEIWASSTSKGDTFQLVSSGTATKTADVVEIKFNPTSFKRIKFVFKNTGTATASEMMFYKEDKGSDQMAKLFTDSTFSKVSEEFSSLEKLNELEESVKNHPLYEEFKESILDAKAIVENKQIEATTASTRKVYYADNSTYNDLYKISSDNIESITNNGGHYGNQVIKNAIDGNLSTYWETNTGNSDSFNNEVEVTFKDTVKLNRIVFAPRQSDLKGFAQEFEIYASQTSKGDTYQLVATGTADSVSGLVEAKFDETEFKRIKFKFKKSTQNWASLSEIMFYQKDSIYDSVDRLFKDSSMNSVNDEFNNIEKLIDLENEAKNHPLYESNLKEYIDNAKAIVSTENIEATKAVMAKISYGENEEYNNLYKISSDNIESITNNGGHYWNQVIKNAIDGNLDTYWETNTANNSSFQNEVEVTFKEPVKINRVVYAPRQSDLKGFAQEVEIYASQTSKGDTYQLVATGSFNEVKGLVEARFNETEFKRLKFKFKKSTQNWASLSEIMFYKEDTLYNKLNNIFTNGLMNELTEDANTLEKIQALEEELNNYPLKAEYTYKIELAKKILENPTKYQEGILVASQRGDSNKEASEHKIARTSYNLDTFGKYVTPGEIINVYVDADASGVMPKLVLGQLANDKNGWTRFYDLKPGVNTIIAPSFNTMSPAVIYVYNPALPSDQSYAPKVRVEGGTSFPVYYHGVTDPAEYEEELIEYNKKISIDDNDFANGVRDDVYYNVTELVSENNLITTSAAGALQGIKEMKSANKTVADTMNDWEKMWHEFQKFSGFVEGDEDPRNDLFNVKFISRVFTKGPYGWSDWGYTGYNGGNAVRRDTGTFKSIVKPFSIGDDWLYYHEWGHNINNSATEEVEITNNLYSAQMRRVFGTGGGEGDRIDWNTLYSRFSGNTVPLDFWTSLGMISQPLYYYGTDTYGKASRIARTNPDGILNGLENNKQRLVITYSLAVGYDLTDFFDGWGYCKATDLMKNKVANLPKPNVKLEYMNTSGIDYKGEGFTEETNVNINSFSINKETKEAKLTFNVDEKDKNDVMGYEILRDGEVVGYTVNNSFTDKNIDINKGYTYEILAYAKDLTTSKKVSISSKTPTLVSNEKITLKLNEAFNPLDYVNAFDYLGTKIDDIKVTQNVDTSRKGIYNVSYEITSNGIKVTKGALVEVVSDYEYLSDSNWTSAQTQYDTVRKNNDLKLFVNGGVKSFEKGFGIHANGEIVYNLEDKNYDKFEAFVGVSRSIIEQNNSSVIFKVLADGKEIYNSGLMKYNTPAKFISVDIKGVNELKIVVNDGGNGNTSDHAVIGSPILITNNVKPTLIVGNDESIELRSDYNLMDSVRANDVEDGNLTNSVVVNENGFTTDRTGEYTIGYSVTDSDENTINAEKKVLVYSERDYLSDINWTSARTDYGSVRKDKASGGANMKLLVNGQVKEFTKGIGTHANSEIVYNLEGKNYGYFETYVGIDRNIAQQDNSSVIFKIYADGVEVYNSGLMKYNTEAKLVRIPVDGVKELKLVADNAGNGNTSDHADFADAKLLVTNSLPTMNVEDITFVEYKGSFDKLSTLTASDVEDGNMISKVVIDGNVDTNKAGVYNLTYTVTDSSNNTVTKERKVVVYSDSKYISDLDWTSARTDYGSVRKDKASGGANIKLLVNGQVKEFTKGIGTHANSEIVYNLEGKNYEYFETYVGIDRNIAQQDNSSVIFKIYADGVEVYNSGLMKYNTEAKLVRIPVDGVKELKLVANNAGNGNTSDHADFADAKFLITNSKPELTIPESISTTLGKPIDINQAYTSIDKEDGDLTANVKVEGTVNFDKTGKYPITYTVVDSDGNEVVKTRTIAVVDMNDFTYLTDLNWKTVNYSYTTPVKDKAINGGAITLTNTDGTAKVFDRGIGSHATSTIVYDLSDKNYSYFTSYVGINRNMYNSVASVGFEVYVDGVLKYSSGVMTSNMPMKFIQVDINDAKELKLVVTDGGNGIGSDHGAWGDAKLHFANENGASIDRTELNELIKTVTELDSKIYTEESFNNLTATLENVNTNLADGYTQEEINNLYNALKEAYDALVKVTNFSALQEVIANNSDLNELHYYKDAITAHKALVEEAKRVLENENATQEEIDSIVDRVNESAEKLVVRENKVELENKIKEAKEITNNNYQAVRWKNFLWAIDYASGIYNDIDATDVYITSALSTLEYMKSELK